MDISPEVALKGSIRPGSVYYFPSERLTSDESHYFVVINLDPFTEQITLLVCGSSRVESVKRRNKDNPPETLVEVTPEEYSQFSEKTIFDCNSSVFKHTIDDLIQRLSSKRLEICLNDMPIEIVERLRVGVLASPVVEYNTKQQLIDKR